MTFRFEPDWVLAPAEILAEWLDEHGLSPAVAAVACAPKGPVRDHCLARIQAVLAKEPLTAEDAQIIAKATMTHARFWEGLEHNYRAGLAAGLTDASWPFGGEGPGGEDLGTLRPALADQIAELSPQDARIALARLAARHPASVREVIERGAAAPGPAGTPGEAGDR